MAISRLVLVATLAAGFAVPAAAQNPQQLLQGLLSGNQGQDNAIRDAFERGYQRGREDQERADRDRGPPPGRGYQQQGYPQQQQGYPPQPYGR